MLTLFLTAEKEDWMWFPLDFNYSGSQETGDVFHLAAVHMRKCSLMSLNVNRETEDKQTNTKADGLMGDKRTLDGQTGKWDVTVGLEED